MENLRRLEADKANTSLKMAYARAINNQNPTDATKSIMEALKYDMQSINKAIRAKKAAIEHVEALNREKIALMAQLKAVRDFYEREPSDDVSSHMAQLRGDIRRLQSLISKKKKSLQE